MFYTSDLTDLDAASSAKTDDASALERLTPVDLRLDKVLAKIPAAVAREGVPLAMIQQQLKGRKQGSLHCHNGELSRALHKRGWRRHLHWEKRQSGEVCTLWYPPGVSAVQQAIEPRAQHKRGRPPKWLVNARKRAYEEGWVF